MIDEIDLEPQEIGQLVKEAIASVEKQLSLEDNGWLKFGSSANNCVDIMPSMRPWLTWRCRRYWALDPLAGQAIRLWTDYTFGSGISYQCKDTKVQGIIDDFWRNPLNRSVLSSMGQRKSSDKLLVDGEVFFAIFIAENPIIRWIDPLEIQEIITDPEDIENPKYYRRVWADAHGHTHNSIYCSHLNLKDEGVEDIGGQFIKATESNVVVYHLSFNTIGQRGNSLLLRALDWIDEYRKFLAARIAIVRALARYAWKDKRTGGSLVVAAAKAAQDGTLPNPASTRIENAGANLEPIKTDTGAFNAEKDGRMIKLMICAALGLPEQYFGDIATGNLATAKTVELPLLKQFSSLQKMWADAYEDIFNVILDCKGDDSKERVDLDFPEIAPADIQAALAAIQTACSTFPQFADSSEVQRQALINIGLNNIDMIMVELEKKTENPTTEARLIKALQGFKEVLQHDMQKV